MDKAESFEVTEYGEDHEIPGRLQGAIKDIVRDQARSAPSMGVQVSFTGKLMKITYHCYEHNLPGRIKEVEHAAKQILDETLKNIKKQIKPIIGYVPDFKEDKSRADTAVQKVSLNERYMYSSWRFYELG